MLFIFVEIKKKTFTYKIFVVTFLFEYNFGLLGF